MSRKQRMRKNEYRPKTTESEKFQLGNRKWVFALITIVIFLVYANGLNNEFVSDDIPTIPENINLTNLRASLAISPYGFVFMIIRYLTALIAGDSPLLYRLVNILFHTGSVNILFAIFGPMIGFGSAIAVALIFAVHPLLTEGVTWISGGPYAMGTFFGLLAIYLYLISQSINKDWKSWLSFVCSLSCFPVAMAMAPIITVYEVILGNWRKNWKRLVFFWLGGISLTIIYISVTLSARVSSIAQQNGGQVSNPSILPQAVVAVYQYIRLYLWPDKLTLYHTEMSFSSQQVIWFALVSFFLLALAIWGWRRDKRITFGVLWFLLGISITINPFGSNWIVAERYVYFASIGLIIVTVLLYQKLIGKRVGGNASWVVLGIILLGLSIKTITRNAEWKNQDTLWIATAKYSPSSAQNHNNLGDLYARRKDYQKAIAEFGRAIEINPRYADAYHNLGNTYLQVGDIEKAEQSYQKALEFNPNLWQSYGQLAAIYANRNDWEKAEKILLKGISIVTPNDSLKEILGKVYALQGNNTVKP